MRIVSLIASATEIIAALGCADQLVGISHECDYPVDAVKGHPVLTSPKLDVRRQSLDIHRDVEKIVKEGLAVYRIDVDQLRAVKPDIIITQDQCEVCAVTYQDVVNAVQSCLKTDAKIVTLHPDSLEDIFRDILKVGVALNVEAKSQKYVEHLRQSMQKIQKEAANILEKPRVLCLEWLNPLMVAGNWVPTMIKMAGGINGITKNGDHTKVVSWEDIRNWDPEILILVPCGYKIEQTFENRDDLERFSDFKTLSAYKNKKIYVVDGNTYVNRPGPRIVESLQIFAGLIHPDHFGMQVPKGAYVPFIDK